MRVIVDGDVVLRDMGKSAGSRPLEPVYRQEIQISFIAEFGYIYTIDWSGLCRCQTVAAHISYNSSIEFFAGVSGRPRSRSVKALLK